MYSSLGTEVSSPSCHTHLTLGSRKRTIKLPEQKGVNLLKGMHEGTQRNLASGNAETRQLEGPASLSVSVSLFSLSRQLASLHSSYFLLISFLCLLILYTTQNGSHVLGSTWASNLAPTTHYSLLLSENTLMVLCHLSEPGSSNPRSWQT